MSGRPCFVLLARLPDRYTPCRPGSAEANNRAVGPASNPFRRIPNNTAGWLSRATCHGLQRPFYKAHSALRGAAAGIVGRLYHHPVVFGKSGKHRANRLAAPVVFRDGHFVPMQNISPPIKTEQQKEIETFWFLHIPHHHSFADRYRSGNQFRAASPGARSKGAWGLARPIVPGWASLLACL